MTKCSRNNEFVINTSVMHIELRRKNGEFVRSIACKYCVKDLEKVIKKFKESVGGQGKRKVGKNDL